jgi:hypothetical protein
MQLMIRLISVCAGFDMSNWAFEGLDETTQAWVALDPSTRNKTLTSPYGVNTFQVLPKQRMTGCCIESGASMAAKDHTS